MALVDKVLLKEIEKKGFYDIEVEPSLDLFKEINK